nr:MAG: nonstructural protein [Microvirus sp.]
MRLYVIYDTVAEEAGPLFQAKNDEVAIRQVKNMLSQEKLVRPSDYKLYHLGSFDQNTMTLTSYDPENVPFEVEKDE